MTKSAQAVPVPRCIAMLGRLDQIHRQREHSHDSLIDPLDSSLRLSLIRLLLRIDDVIS